MLRDAKDPAIVLGTVEVPVANSQEKWKMKAVIKVPQPLCSVTISFYRPGKDAAHEVPYGDIEGFLMASDFVKW